MTARSRVELSNIITGGFLGSTPPVVQTNYQNFIDLVDSGYLNTDTLPAISPVVGTPLLATFGVPVQCDVNIPDAAGTTTYQVIIPFKCTIVGVEVHKAAAGAGNTIQLTTAADVAITDAIVAAVLNAITRQTTIDPAQRDVAAGAIVKVVSVRAAGSSACKVRIWVIKTP